MQLPNVVHAVIDPMKLTEYLLNLGHPQGRSKAEFFAAFGFHLAAWPILEEALHAHARDHPIFQTHDTPFGPRYEIEGPLEAPDGRRPWIRAVWQLDFGQIAPRLITAYPAAHSL